jgi:glutaredoxin
VQKKRVGITPAERSRAAVKELAVAIEKFPVRLYSSPTCAEPCAAARAALNERGVPFQEIQVWDAETNEELKRVSGAYEVPALVIGAQAPMKGFQKEQYENALDAAGYPKRGEIAARVEPPPSPPEGYLPPKERESAATPVK